MFIDGGVLDEFGEAVVVRAIVARSPRSRSRQSGREVRRKRVKSQEVPAKMGGEQVVGALGPNNIPRSRSNDLSV